MSSRNVVTSDRLLAFGFGVIFCGILAYAGLRGQPVNDAGQFWFLRVLAAISAAGVAAVIPGFLQIGFSVLTGLVVRGGGALAVFATVYLVNPPHIITTASADQEVGMIGDYKTDRLDDAERKADAILASEPRNPKALNVKGGIEFYRRNFQKARELFEQAHRYSPGDVFYPMNLAYADIEVGAPLKAEETLRFVNDGKPDWYYVMGRAELYAREFVAAERDLQLVPDEFDHGAARFLEAAAIAGQSSESSSRKEEAAQNLRKALAQGRGYWEGIVTGALLERSQTYDLPISLLKPMFGPSIGLEPIQPDTPQILRFSSGIYSAKPTYYR
jgi:tetratricopeptide (TPR) repeat protein